MSQKKKKKEKETRKSFNYIKSLCAKKILNYIKSSCIIFCAEML